MEQSRERVSWRKTFSEVVAFELNFIESWCPGEFLGWTRRQVNIRGTRNYMNKCSTSEYVA